MLAIICGGGQYPLEISKCCSANNEPFVLVFLDGSCDLSYNWPDVPSVTLSLGKVTQLLSFLRNNKVTEIIFAGHVKRPNFSDLSLDSDARRWLMKLGMSIFRGDDGLLSAISRLFEEEGFSVISPNATLTTEKYILTAKSPSESEIDDIEKGMCILSDISKYDIGQSLIIENGLVVGIECVEGTDALIARSESLKKYDHAGVLVKLSKQGQDARFDMPAVGLNTIKNCYKIGINGIAIERNACIILNHNEVVQFADKHDMFIIGIDRGSKINRALYA